MFVVRRCRGNTIRSRKTRNSREQRARGLVTRLICVLLKHGFENPVVTDWTVDEVLEIPPASSCIATGGPRSFCAVPSI